MKVKYRIVQELSRTNPKTGLAYTQRTIIKSGFTTEKAAEEWNAKHGNPGYIIEAY